MNTTATRPASYKQVQFISDLAREVTEAPTMLLESFGVEHPNQLDMRDASTFIGMLKDARTEVRGGQHARRVLQEAEADIAPLAVGVYQRDGAVIRVYPARNGGHLLAKRYDADSDNWVYLGAATRFVRASMRMSLEDAQRFGHDFGVCACCGRMLTDPTSINDGIGPICAKKYF